jgi:hypothetical protein
LTRDGELLGTFALYSPEPCIPIDIEAELTLIEGAGHIALIAIEVISDSLRSPEDGANVQMERNRLFRSRVDGDLIPEQWDLLVRVAASLN